MNAQRDQVSDAWRANRAYLVDLAFRMLGDVGTAEDVVQEAFFRLVQAPAGDINDERGWLVVVTSRLCLDHMKSSSTTCSMAAASNWPPPSTTSSCSRRTGVSGSKR
jgi:RNA polymerase sigma-70 factor (ECF subfamily)